MSDKFLTPADIAERLQVHERTVLRWLNDGKLHGIKFERLWRVDLRDFEEFINEHKTVKAQ